MEKNVGYLLVVVSVLFLLVGGLVGYNMGEAETITVTETEYQNVSVPQIEYVYAPSQLDKAVGEFLIAVEDEEVEDINGSEVDILGNYNFDELEVSKIYDDYTVSYDDDETTVDFSIRLRFKEEDDKAVKKTFDVTVFFEEDEDTEVIVA